jgi:hypothetical protein
MAALLRTGGVPPQGGREEPRALLAGVLAVLVHLLAVVALIKFLWTPRTLR